MTDEHPPADRHGSMQEHRLPRSDGAALQRRRHGLIEFLFDKCPSLVVSFPNKTASAADQGSRTQQEQTWPASDNNATAALAVPLSTDPSGPPSHDGGPRTIGVLMPVMPLPKELSGYRPQDVGLVTHAAIAIIAPHAQTLDPVHLSERVLDVTGALVNGENVNRRRVLMLTAAGHVANYFRRFAPAPDWDLLGCEFDTTGGRTDLAWQHATTGRVFFDELKTHNRAISTLAADTIAQAKRQGQGGVRLYGDRFDGVRVIPFGALHLTCLVHPNAVRVALAPTPAEPLRLRATGVSR